MKIYECTSKVKERKLGNWVERKKMRMILALYALAVIPTNRALAATDADTKWNDIIDFLLGWVKKLGGGLLIFGLLEVALSFIQNDPGSRSTGIKFAVAGCMVIAIGFSKSLFSF